MGHILNYKAVPLSSATKTTKRCCWSDMWITNWRWAVLLVVASPSIVLPQVSHKVNNEDDWKECFSVNTVRLPLGYYFGVSAATGELAGTLIDWLIDWLSMCVMAIGGVGEQICDCVCVCVSLDMRASVCRTLWLSHGIDWSRALSVDNRYTTVISHLVDEYCVVVGARDLFVRAGQSINTEPNHWLVYFKVKATRNLMIVPDCGFLMEMFCR